MIIHYWCPFLTHVATVDSVKNSALSIKKFCKKKNDVTILNTCGEWNFFKKNDLNIKIFDLQKINFYNFLPKTGFIQSRFSFILIFIINFFKLQKIIKRFKPDYLIIHLLTFLPIILSPIISKNTKIILRISGLPSLNPFRKFLWKFFSKYIYKITTPTLLTKDLLIVNKIFPERKIFLLRDPIINCKKINIEKKIKQNNFFSNKSYYLSIGRLTSQKNFEFLIKNYFENINKFKTKQLVIVGSGENEEFLKNIIFKIGADNNIFLLGYKKNIYSLLSNSEALISTANYEDPGFAIIEAAYLRKKIITSLVKNGPLEMFNENEKMCFFFQKNNKEDFINKIIESESDNFNKKILLSQKFSKKFTLFNHYKELTKLLD